MNVRVGDIIKLENNQFVAVSTFERVVVRHADKNLLLLIMFVLLFFVQFFLIRFKAIMKIELGGKP